MKQLGVSGIIVLSLVGTGCLCKLIKTVSREHRKNKGLKEPANPTVESCVDKTLDYFDKTQKEKKGTEYSADFSTK